MKKHLTLLGGLKFTAVLCTCFPILPVFAGLMLVPRISATGYSMAWMLLFCLFSCLVGILCGAVLIPLLARKKGILFDLLGNLSTFLVSILCGGAGFLAGRQFLPIPADSAWVFWYVPIVAGVCCLVACFLGCRCWEDDYNEIIRVPYLAALVILDLLCSLLFWIFKTQLDMLVLSLTLLFSACVYAAAENQGNIDYLMQKRSHNHNILPRRMRWYSFSLVAGISVLIFAGYFLRKPVAALFRGILGILKAGLAALLSLLPSGENGEAVPETPIAPSQTGDMGLPPADSEPSIFWTFFGILVAALFVWILIFYRHEILGALRTLWGKIRDFFADILFRQAHISGPADSNEYFEDNVEELAREPGSFWKKEKPYDLRRWKKEYKAFRSMPNGTEKLREGYRLAMQYLLLRKVSINESDTPMQILQKGKTILPEDLLTSVTNAYCLTRYRDESPREDDIRQTTALLTACDSKK